MSKGDKEKWAMEITLRKYFDKSEIVREHKGIKGRQFRFDWAVPHLKLAVEYEGLFSTKSRHTTISGYSTDCTKYNLAMLNGWRLLRYTAATYQNFDVNLHTFLRDFDGRVKDN